MTTLCFVFGRTQAAPSLFLCGFRKNRDFAGISLGAERFLGEEEQRQQVNAEKGAGLHREPGQDRSLFNCVGFSCVGFSCVGLSNVGFSNVGESGTGWGCS